MCVKWLEDILREQAVINTRIFVLFELGQLILTDVNHGCRVPEECDEMQRSLMLLFWLRVEEKHEVAKWRVLACDCGNDVGHQGRGPRTEPWKREQWAAVNIVVTI